MCDDEPLHERETPRAGNTPDKQPDYTTTARALPGCSRPEPVTDASAGNETPAPAGNSGRKPAVPVVLLPACHAGGRGFESGRSRKNPCKSAACVDRADTRSTPTTQLSIEARPKRPKKERKPSQARRRLNQPAHVRSGGRLGASIAVAAWASSMLDSPRPE